MTMENPLPSPRPFFTEHLHDAPGETPWMAKMQAWLEDQNVWGPKVTSQTTRDWVWQQQMRETERLDAERRAREKVAERKWWEATARSIDEEADRWMAQAEAARKAVQRETEKTRRVLEEVRRVRQRSEALDAERRKARQEARMNSEVESRAQKEVESRAKAQVARETAGKRLVDAWTSYERRWTSLLASPVERLTFRTIPWPLVVPPSNPSSICDANIALFLLSPLHSATKSRKERIRDAMQRWHNDKFEPRILPRVAESDRKAVKEGVDTVVRCLNDLLARQTNP